MSEPAEAVSAVLCDLDDTLFDHAHATRFALAAVQGLEPSLARWPLDAFVERHDVILEALHTRVLAGEMTVSEARLQRFGDLLAAAGAADAACRALDVARAYRQAYEEGWRAVPGALALLDALRARGCLIVVVTNNGIAEQRLKLERCDLARRVDRLLTSEEAGVAKPDRAIFDAALRHAGADATQAVVFGDAWTTDVEGARAAGIRPVWFNPRGRRSPDRTVVEVAALMPTETVLDALLAPAPLLD